MARWSDVASSVRHLPAPVLGRALARAPLVARAEALLAALPRTELVELTGPVTVTSTIAASETRHAWSLGAMEQVLLQVLVQSRRVTSAFEIGTFNGGTTRVLAEALPAGGRVVTLDLPPAPFDRSQAPQDFSGTDVGLAYRDSPSAGKVTQLLADSLSFDPSPYAGQFDLVLVDGGHEHEHGLADSRTALRLVKPGGIVLWDDFEPYWHGLVRGICEAMQGRELVRLAGTSFGAYVAPEA